jgi:hypothetical protein
MSHRIPPASEVVRRELLAAPDESLRKHIEG